MLKIILVVFIVLFVVLCFTLGIKVEYEKDTKKKYNKDTFEAEISALEDKIFYYKRKAEEGVDQAKEKLEKYTKELEEIKQFQNKLKNHE